MQIHFVLKMHVCVVDYKLCVRVCVSGVLCLALASQPMERYIYLHMYVSIHIIKNIDVCNFVYDDFVSVYLY